MEGVIFKRIKYVEYYKKYHMSVCFGHPLLIIGSYNTYEDAEKGVVMARELWETKWKFTINQQ